MSTIPGEQTAHSADVQMHLSVAGQVLTIGRLGPDYVILDSPIDHPPSVAEVSLSVDGQANRWQVWLADGLSASRPRTPISKTS